MEEPTVGSEFAGYRIEDFAGQGGMGVVFRATQIALRRPVALKLISPELAGDADFRAIHTSLQTPLRGGDHLRNGVRRRRVPRRAQARPTQVRQRLAGGRYALGVAATWAGSFAGFGADRITARAPCLGTKVIPLRTPLSGRRRAGARSVRSITRRTTTFISNSAKLAPMQRRMPPPKGSQV